MKCEICHQGEAATAITVKRDGVERELYVCPSCAAAHKRKQHPGTPRKASAEVQVLGAPGEEPPPFVEEFLKATLGFMKNVAEAGENADKACPVCKMKWDTIKETGILGCPACWKAFAKKIRSDLLSAQYAPFHKGAAPAIETLESPVDARAALLRELADAIAREDYHRAAEIKHRLDGLVGGGTEAAT